VAGDGGCVLAYVQQRLFGKSATKMEFAAQSEKALDLLKSIEDNRVSLIDSKGLDYKVWKKMMLTKIDNIVKAGILDADEADEMDTDKDECFGSRDTQIWHD
jgi:hypothetical protein